MSHSQVQASSSTDLQDFGPTSARLPQDPRALIAPLLSGLPFLAMHGYQRRGMDLSISCRFSSPTSTGMVLCAYPEGKQTFELEGIAFRVEISGDSHPHRLIALDRSGNARIEGVSRADRVTLTLAAEK